MAVSISLKEVVPASSFSSFWVLSTRSSVWVGQVSREGSFSFKYPIFQRPITGSEGQVGRSKLR